MSAISLSNRFVLQRAARPASTRTITPSQRAKLWGAAFGVTFGAILAAIPFATNVLTFGAFGTLMIAAVECAVIAGGFVALAAALFGEAGANPAVTAIDDGHDDRPTHTLKESHS